MTIGIKIKLGYYIIIIITVHSLWEASKITSQCTSVKPINMESQKYLQHFLLNKKMFWLSSFLDRFLIFFIWIMTMATADSVLQ